MKRYILINDRIQRNVLIAIQELPLDGTMSVVIEEVADIRTKDQNARYWAGVITAIQQWIYANEGRNVDKIKIHEWLKVERYGMTIEMIGGKVQHVPKRSRNMGKKEFAQFADWAEAYAIDTLGVPVEMIDGYAESGA